MVMLPHENTKGAAAKRRLFYLALPLPLITGYMPSVLIGAVIDMHRDSCCDSAFISDDVRL